MEENSKNSKSVTDTSIMLCVESTAETLFSGNLYNWIVGIVEASNTWRT